MQGALHGQPVGRVFKASRRPLAGPGMHTHTAHHAHTIPWPACCDTIRPTTPACGPTTYFACACAILRAGQALPHHISHPHTPSCPHNPTLSPDPMPRTSTTHCAMLRSGRGPVLAVGLPGRAVASERTAERRFIRRVCARPRSTFHCAARCPASLGLTSLLGGRPTCCQGGVGSCSPDRPAVPTAPPQHALPAAAFRHGHCEAAERLSRPCRPDTLAVKPRT
eukprot:363925-Chlamydomonas_euryale.AAC.26